MELQDQVISLARKYLLSGEVSEPGLATERALDDLAIAGAVSKTTDEGELADFAKKQFNGFGVLQDLLDDDAIEEIWINRPNEVFFSKHGVVVRQDLALDADQLQTFVHRMLRNSNRKVDRVSPFADASISNGSRLHVAIPEVTAQHWSVNIRKFSQSIRNLDQLIALNMVTPAQAAYLAQQVQDGRNILISGPTHSGKTTLLSALLDCLPAQTRLITCEETFEIRSSLADWVAMQTRQANLEGIGEIALRRLVKEALRMRPDRLVIGEVREAESFDLLIAMNSGLPGLCTIHANSAAAALQKLSTLPLLAGPNITNSFITNIIASSLDLVVQVGFENKRRIVKEIASVAVTSGELQVRQVKL